MEREYHWPVAHREGLIDGGYELATHMSWDAVAENYIVPGIERACRAQKLATIA